MNWASKLIDQLPKKERMIIQLREIEHYEFVRILKILNLPEMNIRVYLSRIREKIKINKSKKIKKLLDSYFEGKISISQEIILRVYFTSTKQKSIKLLS